MSGQLERELERMMKALHAEWERCGVPVREIFLLPEDAKKTVGLAVEKIRLQQERLAAYETRFLVSLNMSKENFVLLRLVKKLQRAVEGPKSETGKKSVKENGAKRKSPCILLDREEYKLFLELVSQEETVTFWERKIS